MNPEIEKLIDRLHANGRLRVWSIVITILGDSVVPRGGRVSAVTLSAITQALRIEPVALRSALSRLAKEGWIVREKQGRHSFYTLTSEGAQSFAPATRRIYASHPPQAPDTWTIAISGPLSKSEKTAQRSAMEGLGYTSLDDRIYLNLKPDTQSLTKVVGSPAVISGDFSQIPTWLQDASGTPETAAVYREIHTVFSGVYTGLSPVEALVARSLLIHEWRRAVLRHADLPAALFPTDWPAQLCRNFVANLYQTLSVDADKWLDDAPDLNVSPPDATRRFQPRR